MVPFLDCTISVCTTGFLLLYIQFNLYINVQSINCNEASEASQCIGETLFDPNSITCGGSFSCYNASIMGKNISAPTSTIGCYGSNACSHVGFIVTLWLYCGASNACSYSVTGDANYVQCQGYLSCSHLNILDTGNVIGFGTYSLYNATIESGDRYSVTNILLYGYYAGYKATIICHPHHTCDIQCFLNGCYMLFLNCSKTAVCNVYKTPNDTVGPIYISDVPYFDDFEIDLQHFSEHNMDDECTNNSTNFDTYFSVENIDIDTTITTSICCRGYRACVNDNSTIVTQITATEAPILICSGQSSCGPTNIISDNAVFCEGEASCMGSETLYTHINTTNDIYCSGYYSCSSAIIHDAKNITCSGHLSCAHAYIHTSGLGKVHNVYFIGHRAGYFSYIYCKTDDECFIQCGAYDACNGVNLFCDGTCIVKCDESSLCPTVSSASYGNVTIIKQETLTYIQTPTWTLTSTYRPLTTLSGTAVPSETIDISAAYSTETEAPTHIPSLATQEPTTVPSLDTVALTLVTSTDTIKYVHSETLATLKANTPPSYQVSVNASSTTLIEENADDDDDDDNTYFMQKTVLPIISAVILIIVMTLTSYYIFSYFIFSYFRGKKTELKEHQMNMNRDVEAKGDDDVIGNKESDSDSDGLYEVVKPTDGGLIVIGNDNNDDAKIENKGIHSAEPRSECLISTVGVNVTTGRDAMVHDPTVNDVVNDGIVSEYIANNVNDNENNDYGDEGDDVAVNRVSDMTVEGDLDAGFRRATNALQKGKQYEEKEGDDDAGNTVRNVSVDDDDMYVKEEANGYIDQNMSDEKHVQRIKDSTAHQNEENDTRGAADIYYDEHIDKVFENERNNK